MVHDSAGLLCTDKMRSVLVHYASSAAPPKAPVLEPTFARKGETLTLRFLSPDIPTDIVVYDSSGRMLERKRSVGAERILLTAPGVAGCYQVLVTDGDQRYVLRYIVIQ